MMYEGTEMARQSKISSVAKNLQSEDLQSVERKRNGNAYRRSWENLISQFPDREATVHEVRDYVKLALRHRDATDGEISRIDKLKNWVQMVQPQRLQQQISPS